MSYDKIIQINAYLYQIQKGVLNIYEGNVHRTWKEYEGAFITKTKNRMCSSKSEFVCNAAVWLHERNDDLARALLIQYEEEEISILNKKIENHKMKILILKGEM